MRNYKYWLLFIIIVILTGCGNVNNKDLTCTKIYDDGSEQIFVYSFENGKACNIGMTLTLPESGMSDAEAYEMEFNKVNDIGGCNGEFTKNADNSYTTVQSCDLSKMSDSSISKLFFVDRENLEISREKIIDNYSYDDQMICK